MTALSGFIALMHIKADHYDMVIRPWRIVLKFLPIFLFFYSPIFHLLFNPFFFNVPIFLEYTIRVIYFDSCIVTWLTVGCNPPI